MRDRTCFAYFVTALLAAGLIVSSSSAATIINHGELDGGVSHGNAVNAFGQVAGDSQPERLAARRCMTWAPLAGRKASAGPSTPLGRSPDPARRPETSPSTLSSIPAYPALACFAAGDSATGRQRGARP